MAVFLLLSILANTLANIWILAIISNYSSAVDRLKLRRYLKDKQHYPGSDSRGEIRSAREVSPVCLEIA